MDGLLIDSEPLWRDAGRETLQQYGHTLTDEQYHTSTGLRTSEWIELWFTHFGIDMAFAAEATGTIIEKAIKKIEVNGQPLPGVPEITGLFRKMNFRMGLATSSPLSLVEVVLKKLNLTHSFDAIASAGDLPYGKPHPMVYLNCAAALQIAPVECIAFEDSFNGMIAAKAARMKCVVVPEPAAYDHPKWHAADLTIRSLEHFTREMLDGC